MNQDKDRASVVAELARHNGTGIAIGQKSSSKNKESKRHDHTHAHAHVHVRVHVNVLTFVITPALVQVLGGSESNTHSRSCDNNGNTQPSQNARGSNTEENISNTPEIEATAPPTPRPTVKTATMTTRALTTPKRV